MTEPTLTKLCVTPDNIIYWKAEFPRGRTRTASVYRVTTLLHGTLARVETWDTHRKVSGRRIEQAIREALAIEMRRSGS